MDKRQQVLQKLDKEWSALIDSYAGLQDDELLQAGVTDRWSVRDIIAHVTTWEEEALKHLPSILKDERPPRYSVTYGGIDAFNAQTVERKKTLSLAEVLRQRDEVHDKLIKLIQRAPEEQLESKTRFRRRLRADTYAHYPKHAEAIRKWRERLKT